MSNVGIYDAYKAGFDAIDYQAQKIRDEMADIKANPDGDNTTKMLELQMNMGKYNAMIELTSNISKSICDTMKSLAQKVN